MPIYEYECQECAERVEAFQKVSDEPLAECPKCEGRLKKVFHPVATVFKGSGFYTTDYARKKSAPAGEKRASGQKGEGAAGSDGGPSAESEAKPPAKEGAASPASKATPSTSSPKGDA